MHWPSLQVVCRPSVTPVSDISSQMADPAWAAPAPTAETQCVCPSLCRRNDALKTRADGKIQKRKDKREKKLMRAGFEGRRDTPLGT